MAKCNIRKCHIESDPFSVMSACLRKIRRTLFQEVKKMLLNIPLPDFF